MSLQNKYKLLDQQRQDVVETQSNKVTALENHAPTIGINSFVRA
jgi:hypothetical protein